MGYQNNVINSTSANNYIPILVIQSDGKLRGTLWTTANRDMSVVSSSAVNDGNWHRVDMSVTTTSINIYLDGSLVGTNTSGTVNHLDMIYNQLGRGRTDSARDSPGGDLTGWQGFTGCIDNFMILDKGQTLTQINQSTAPQVPTITSFAPTTAKSGETIVITGTNLSGATGVNIGGVAARSFTAVSSTEIRAIVPKDATVSTTVQIISQGGNVSAPNFTFDCASNSIDFDGSNDHILVGDRLENLGAVTQEAWVFWKGSNHPDFYNEIFTKDFISALAITNDNKLHANFGNGTTWGAGVNSTTLIPLNTWTHIAVTRSASGSVKMYINGVLDASTATLNLTGENAAIRAIGAKPVSSSRFGHFKGAIDDLKVWNTERTETQILEGMSTELVGNETGLVAYYNFNQGTAAGTNTALTILNNLTSALNFDGTLTSLALTGSTSNFIQGVGPVITRQPLASTSVCAGGSISVSAVGRQLTYQWYSNSTASNSGGIAISGQTTASLTIPSDATGTNYYYVVVSGACSQSVTSNVSTVIIAPNNGLNFDGVNDYVQAGAPLPLTSSGNFTIEAWVKPSVIDANYRGFFGKQGSLGRAPSIWVGPSGSLHTDAYNASNTSDRYDLLVNNFFEVNTWTHVAYVRSGNTFIVYKNGVQVTTRTAPANVFLPNESFDIGRVDNYLNGTLDEVRVWNTARTAQQIQTNLGQELVGNESGLLAYYNFNQGVAGGNNTAITTLTNATSTANMTGTLTGFQRTGSTSNFVSGVWPVITVQPVASATVCPGGSISVSAIGAPLSYQWFSNTTASTSGGTAISGATSATYNIPNTATGTNYYYVVVTGACGQTETSRVSTITIAPLPVIAYSASYSFERTVAISAVTPTSTGATVSSYTISPALPTGLTLNPTTGVITGTPTVNSTSRSYTVTATSALTCTGTTTFTLEVFSAVAPSALSYSPATQTVRQGTAITAMTPTISGGTPTYTISPALPAGLSINATTGVISGTLTAAQSGTVTHTITAANSGGSVTATVSLIYNTAPTGIALAPAAVAENASSGTTVGTLSATDADTGDTFTYTLVSGTGATDNAIFTIAGANLRTAAVFDFETKASYSVRVRVTDAGGLTFERALTITVTNVNEVPTVLTLSAATVAENAGSGTTVGILSATDVDVNDTFTYTLVSGTGSTDNASFTIDGTSLKTAAVFDFETKNSYSVRVRVTDAGGLTFERALTITVTNVNEAPTVLTLSAATVAENAASGTTVGTLSATDADTGDTFTYALVSGTGSTDNASFAIDGTILKTAAVFDFETKNSYSVRVRVTDAGGLTFERALTIAVTDVNEDSDGDGVKDDEERADGTDPLDACSFKIASQNATPSDAWKAADCDTDGLTNQREKELGTDPLKADTDGDGVPDGVEVTEGTDPLDASKYKDTDGDLVPNFVETAEGTATGDSLNYKDSDKDGVPDYIELRDGTNPNSATSFKDTDGGGVPDYVEVTLFPNLGLAATNATQRGDDEQDTDGDGVPDYQEVLAGDSPKDASDFLDTDGDGVPDFVELKQGTNPNNPKDAKDSDGDGVPDHVQVRSIQLSVLKQVTLAWGTKNHLAQLPTTVEVGIYSGEKTNFEVVWNKTETLNILKRGTYELKGTIVLPKGYYNPYLVNGVVRVVVLPKPAPRDVTITNNTFVGSTTQFFIPVGSFVVNDPVDNIHVVNLNGPGYDNKYFYIENNILYWNSAERAPGKTKFNIIIRVTDRDGNTLDKFFDITRTRPDFNSLTIYNTFTPNGDRFNETWGVPEVRFYEGARIAVYERGGARVFYTENPDVRWDGTYNGKEMPVGSYYWVIQIEETGATRRGIVNLLRK
jgi:gliding motility-associated-like protein